MTLTVSQAYLVEAHLGVAQAIARDIARRSVQTDLDDLIGAAYEALVQCALEFDPDRGATFATFARKAVRWRMIDRYRKDTRTRRAQALWTCPLGVLFEDDDEGDPSVLAVEDPGYEAVLDAVHAAATIETVHLTDRERRVLVLVGDGATLRQAGRILGFTESRACQIRTGVYWRLPEHRPDRPPARKRPLRSTSASST